MLFFSFLKLYKETKKEREGTHILCSDEQAPFSTNPREMCSIYNMYI